MCIRDRLIDGEYEATARDVTDEPQETPVPAAPQPQPEQEPEPAPRRFVWKLSPRLTGLLACLLYTSRLSAVCGKCRTKRWRN